MARKVLIADDSPTVQKKASGILVGEGMEVVTVSNGVAAIKKLPTVNPMVILADVAMPGKDGYEVCEFVKASKEYANVPVLLVFSDGDLYDEQRGARVRADGRVKKPFDREELISTVTRHLVAAEEAAAKLAAAPIVTKAPPPPSFVAEPVDEEPIIEQKESVPDFSQFGGGVAFAEALEEISATPAEPAAPVESAPTLVEAEAPIIEAPVIEPEAPAPPPAAPQEEEWRPASPEPVEPATEAVAQAESVVQQEPVLIEEHAAPEHTHEHPHEHPHEPTPAAERTMLFRAPAEIAQPILSDELAATSAPAEPASIAASAEVAVEPAEAPAAPSETAAEPASAMSLDSYSLSEAAAGQVHVAHGEAASEAPPIAPPEAAPPEPVVAEAAPAVAEVAEAAVTPSPTPEAQHALDASQIYAIVHMVVAKMSPRLPAEAIEGIAKPIADEITAELTGPRKN